ncbi:MULTISPECIES: zinc-dependent metalloprotease [unclassified Janibacter]|uniref:zinc-dependent metalloprotease n=1 Tax=unclassified Janibacter TaxID=2649294 RepID=UPI003CFD8185
MATTTYVDWTFAKSAGRKLVPAGPEVSSEEAHDIVEAVRAAAAGAVQPVAETARMHAPGEAPAPLVVDRPSWIDANADSMAQLLDPVIAKVAAAVREGKEGRPEPSPLIQAVGGKVTGAEVGAMLAFMAGKVLGQYDLAPGGTPKLMLVAPNLVQVQRQLDVDAADFRSWVCMHEETHRVQFTAVPWLRDHMIQRTQALATDMVPDGQALKDKLDQLGKRLPDVFKGDGQGLAELVINPQQREQMARVTAIMSLLEGHADVIMDEVGPAHIPSVEEIRTKFNAKRKGGGAADRLLRRLLGLEAKMRQYRDGAVFVRAVVDKVGMDGFNEIWTSPETLPMPSEITHPDQWVRRVHG